jgi:hypothetical protein
MSHRRELAGIAALLAANVVEFHHRRGVLDAAVGAGYVLRAQDNLPITLTDYRRAPPGVLTMTLGIARTVTALPLSVLSAALSLDHGQWWLPT